MLTVAFILFFLLCIFMVFVIVIQPGRGEGLAGAFGGGGMESFFGTRAGQHMNRFTIVIAALFLLLALLINLGNRSAAHQDDHPTPEPAPVSGQNK